jgi:hypothetical protein
MFPLVVLSVLALLGPQVVLASFKFNISQVVQCEPVNIIFSGSDSNNHSVPTTLTILPLIDNASPIKIPIPNGATNSTGIQLSFIPLPESTLFLASLDDIEGPSPKVSDVTKVAPPTNPAATTCFGSGIPNATFYQFNDVLNQCETFSITYTTPVAPNITAFVPRVGAASVPLFSSSIAGTALGTASYMMNISREVPVVLLFDDGAGHLQTTKQITVGGDSTSSKSCFTLPSSASSKSKSSSKTKGNALSQPVIIGIAVGASLVGVIGILLLAYILRERRRRRRISDMEFDPALLNRKWPPDEKQGGSVPSSAPPHFSADANGYVRDPIYTNENYTSSLMSDARTSIGSWNQFIPSDQRSHQDQRASTASSSSRISLNTVDVQNILQMATVHRDPTSDAPVSEREVQPPSTAGTSTTRFEVAKPAVARLVSMRRRTSDPPDMPAAMMRNDSARAAAVEAVPPGYGPSSYVSFGDTDDDESSSVDGNDSGIGGYPVPTVRKADNPRDTSESWGNVVVM